MWYSTLWWHPGETWTYDHRVNDFLRINIYDFVNSFVTFIYSEDTLELGRDKQWDAKIHIKLLLQKWHNWYFTNFIKYIEITISLSVSLIFTKKCLFIKFIYLFENNT